jgi:flavoprotein
MGKMSELHAQKEVIDNIDKYYDKIEINIYYSDDEETGMRNYDFENMQKDFDEKMKELEVDAEMRQEGWNDKQRDYAMDNMTCDVQDKGEDQ